MKKNIFRVLSFIMIFAMVVGMANIGGVQRVNAAVSSANDLTKLLSILEQESPTVRDLAIQKIATGTHGSYVFNDAMTSTQISTAATNIGNITLVDSSKLSSKITVTTIQAAITDLQTYYDSSTSEFINYGLNKLSTDVTQIATIDSNNNLFNSIANKFLSYNLFLTFLKDVKDATQIKPLDLYNDGKLEINPEIETLADAIRAITGFSQSTRFDYYENLLKTNYLNEVNSWTNSSEKQALLADLQRLDLYNTKQRPVTGTPAPAPTPAPATPIAVGTVTTEKNAAGGTVSKVAVDAKVVDKLITESKTNNVSLDLTSVKGSAEVKVELTSAILNKVIDSKMGIEIKGENATIVLPQEIAKQIGQASGTEKVTININIVPAAPTAPASMKVVGQVLDFSIKAGDKEISKFDKNIKAELKVDMSQISDYRKVVASYYNETTKQWEAVNGYLNKLTGVLSFYTNHFSKYAAVENKRAFTDVSTPWAKESIEVLAARNIMNGNSTSTFAPKANITRAEVAAIITRSLNLDTTTVAGKFSDVPSSKWYAKEVEAAANAGIITGIGNNKFAPEDEITREQIAVMISRALEYKQGKAATIPAATFTDAAKISSYAKNAVAVVASKGIVKGSENKFNPADKATREEVAVMLYRLLGILGQM